MTAHAAVTALFPSVGRQISSEVTHVAAGLLDVVLDGFAQRPIFGPTHQAAHEVHDDVETQRQFVANVTEMAEPFGVLGHQVKAISVNHQQPLAIRRLVDELVSDVHVAEYVDRVAKLREDIDALFDSSTLEEQREIYETRVKPVLWGRLLKWLTRRDFALAMLGVPRSQRRQIDSMYPGGVAAYIVNQVEELLTNVPLKDNYFWRVYIRGEYTRDCCPEYLKPENFRRLKEGLVDRVEIHTDTVFGFLSRCSSNISRFVLLDHMDWLYDRSRDLLEREWQVIVDRAAPGTRVIWRSAAPSVEFVDPLTISLAGAPVSLGQLLCYDHELATHLHAQDRVHTYGSFYIAQAREGPGGDENDRFGRR